MRKLLVLLFPCIIYGMNPFKSAGHDRMLDESVWRGVAVRSQPVIDQERVRAEPEAQEEKKSNKRKIQSAKSGLISCGLVSCDQTFDDKESYHLHLKHDSGHWQKKKNDSGDILVCLLCNTTRFQSNQLWEHMRSHAGYYDCKICRLRTASAAGLCAHVKAHG